MECSASENGCSPSVVENADRACTSTTPYSRIRVPFRADAADADQHIHLAEGKGHMYDQTNEYASTRGS